MRHKIALTIASIAASATLAVALAAAGFTPGAAQQAVPVSVPLPTATPQIQVDTVYLAPPPPQQTITIQQNAAPVGEGDDGEGNEAGEGDD